MAKPGFNALQLFETLSCPDDGMPAQGIREWTLNKLALLAYYLPAFASICDADRGGWYYVDGFAGRGVNVLSGAGRYRGTALIGLSAGRGPVKAVLVERDQANAELLRRRSIALVPDESRWQVFNGDFNVVLDQVLQELSDRTLPGLLTLDPFATELNWSSVELAAKWRKHVWPYEMLIYFPTTAVERMGAVTAEPQRSIQEDHLDRFFGTPDWRFVAEEQHRKILAPGVAGARYLELYRQRVEQLGYLPLLTRAIQRTAGRRVYHLLFATANKAGHRIMSDGLNKAFMSTLPLKLQ